MIIYMSKTLARFALALAGLSALASSTSQSCGAAPNPAGELIFQDNFTGKLGDGWSFEREDRACWRVSSVGLEVRVQPGNMWGGANNAKNVLLRSIPTPTDVSVEISVALSNQPTAQWEQANLVWFYDDSNMVKLGQELVTGRLSIVMGREEGDRARTVAIVPLDAHAVELRLQAIGNYVRGQFRTAAWRDWRDAGMCDLPVKGDPKASLHFYNGPPDEEHWVRVNQFSVRQLARGAVNWPRPRKLERTSSHADPQRHQSEFILLPDSYSLQSDLSNVSIDPKAEYKQSIYLHADDTFGWHWDRQTSSNTLPVAAGVNLGVDTLSPIAPKSMFPTVSLSALKSFDVELNAVTLLENDHGDHNLVLIVNLASGKRLSIWFDWYGPASDQKSLNDGYRDYGRLPTPRPNEVQYRIQGFRGAPPKVNLKTFLDDAAQHGLDPQSKIAGVWFGNEIWTGSRGATLVTQLDVIVDGRRFSAVPAAH
jgi:regulation of enolase protein 1 (concanavalin A-like superfamily)